MNKIKGFTLVEMLLICQIIIIFECIYLPFTNHNFQHETVTIQKMITCIENARMDAILNQRRTEMQFKDNIIIINSNKINEFEDLFFYDSYSIHFNSYGHISKACTIQFKLKRTDYHLIFNLGQRAFYIEKI